MKTILFEYDTNLSCPDILNHAPGIWKVTLTPAVKYYTDDQGITGFYRYNNEVPYNVGSLSVDGELYSKVTSYADCVSTNESFYYDTSDTKLYMHFDNFDNPVGKTIYVGISIGYAMSTPDNNRPRYNDRLYLQLVKSISNVSKKIDSVFFGRIATPNSNVSLDNTDGEFDDWRDKNAFGQPARILYGDDNETYDNLENLYEGTISNDSRNWQEFNLNLVDERGQLTQPISENMLTATDYPDMNLDYVDTPIPVSYGKIYNAQAIPLDEGEAPAPANYTFIYTDTTYNNAASLDAVYVDGVSKTPSGSTLSAGTFTLASADVGSDFDKVTCDFTMTITNGVDIIKDLMLNYDNKTYNTSFWDTTEVDAAQAISDNTSLHITDKAFSLKEAVENVSSDISARFFTKNDGLLTVRVYDATRPVDHVIYYADWLGEPDFENNGQEFLSSCIVKYRKNQTTGHYRSFENTDFEEAVFAQYRKKKSAEYETGLYEAAAASNKSDDIMRISSNILDTIKRSVTWDYYDIELGDFIQGSPENRYEDDSVQAVYEVIGIDKNFNNQTIGLTMKQVDGYNILEYGFSALIDDAGDYIITDTGDTIALKELV
jgi:hypothetical protein